MPNCRGIRRRSLKRRIRRSRNNNITDKKEHGVGKRRKARKRGLFVCKLVTKSADRSGSGKARNSGGAATNGGGRDAGDGEQLLLPGRELNVRPWRGLARSLTWFRPVHELERSLGIRREAGRKVQDRTREKENGWRNYYLLSSSTFYLCTRHRPKFMVQLKLGKFYDSKQGESQEEQNSLRDVIF